MGYTSVFTSIPQARGSDCLLLNLKLTPYPEKIEVESEVDKGTTFTVTFNKEVSNTVFKNGDKHRASSRLVAEMR